MPGEGDGADGFASQPGVGPCPFIGKIETIAGTCSLIRAGRVIVEIKIGDPVCRGDVVKTAADGRVGIRFIDGTAFSLSNNARMMLREFACGGDSPSALFDVTRGAFAFIAGEMAKAGHLGIDTPVASIRGRTRTGGVGTLTLSALIFAVMEEARAESPGDAFLDDGTIPYNGVFELVTKEPIPRHYLVDNPLEKFVLHRNGSSVSAELTINSNSEMEQLHKAQQDALHVFALGLAQGPTATGPGGSDGPPGIVPPSFFTQPINFTPPPDNTPPPPGPTGPGPTIPTPSVFLPVIFTPPPTGPGKINELPGHTGDTTDIDTTSSTVPLSFGAATLSGPTFVWSAGPLTSGQEAGLTVASTLTLSDSGGSIGFTYSAVDHTFDFLAQGETLTITYDVTAGGVTKPATIIITGTNDTPVITSGTQSGSITEEKNASQPNPTGSTDLDKASGAVTFTDVDLSDTHTVTVTGVVASGVTTGLASNATALGWLTLGTLSDSTGGVTGSDAWTFSAQDKNFDYLAVGETLTLTYTVQVDDGHGGLTSQPVIVTITGTNDTPVITSGTQSGSITEEKNASQPNPTGSTDLDKASGAVTFTDVDLSDTHTVTVTGVVASGVTTGLASNATALGWLTLGTLSDSTGGVTGSDAWTFSAQDKNFDYLAVGETLTLTYTVQVDDGHGGLTSQPVIVTVTGTNDTPVITSGTQSGSITEEKNASQPNPTGSTDLDKASGAVTFTDVDLSDTHTVTVTGVVASGVTTGLASNATALGWLTLGTLSDSTGGVTGSDAWTFSAQDKNFDYLAVGETLTLTYTVQVDDGHGGLTSQPVIVTITGTNDTPVITSGTQSGSITEEKNASQPNPTGSTDLDKASGAVTFTDVDLSDTHTVTVTGVVASGVTTGLASNATALGWLTLGTLSDSTGGVTGSDAWTFSAQDKNFDYLAVGETLTLTYTVQVDDGHGGLTSQPVIVTVTGTNDTPVIAVAGSDSAAATLTESYKTLSTTGTLTVTDVDLSDSVTSKVTGVTLGGTTGGLTSADVLDMLSVTAGSIAANPTDADNLAWSFNSNPQTFSFLDAGESLTLTYTVQVNDGHGGIATQPVTITINGTNQPDLVTSFTGIDSHGYFGEHTPVIVHVSDGGVDVTSHATYQWEVLQPGHFGQPSHWVQVSTSNSFSQVETYEGEQLRVTVSYAEAGGTDSITTYLGQISDNDSDDPHPSVKIQNLPNNLLIADGTALELAAASALAVFFPTTAGAYGTLVIDHAAGYTGTISNFTGTTTQSDAIDLKDIAFDSGLSFTYNDNSGANTGGTLTISESGHVVDTVAFANGDYSAANFTLLSDGHGGTLIADPPSSATTGGAATLTTGIDTLTFDNGAHQVSGTDQTVNNGDKLTGGTGANTLTIDSGNGNHNYTFGDGNHADIGLTNFTKLALTDAHATSDDAVAVTFDSSFHNNGTLTVDGSALTHLNGANLTIDAHLAASDSFVIIGSASADTLIGGSNGNNTITGGGGGDTLTGNGANDTFVYKFTTDSQPGAGHFDTITNFTHTLDHFDFSAISGLNSAVQGVTFNSLTAAPDSLAAHTIDIVTSGDNTVVYANASGATETLAHVDMEIHVNNATNVHSGDFILHA